jgi:para-aminobenzoate synthetase component 1
MQRESRTSHGGTLPLVEELPWPADASDLIHRIAAWPAAIVFDSARPDQSLGRYSFLAADPFEVIRSRPGRVQILRTGRSAIERAGGPLDVLATRLADWRTEPVLGLPPFQGGVAGLFSYDLCHHIERLPRPRFDEFQSPDLAVGFYDWVLALDHADRRAWLLSTGLPETQPSRRHRRAEARLIHVRRYLTGRLIKDQETRIAGTHRDGPAIFDPRSSPGAPGLDPQSLAPQWPVPDVPGVTSNFSRDDYLRAVERAIEYIYAGDVYQVNLSQRLLAPLIERPIELYLRLRERNPAPFAGYFDAGDVVIASASPERFLRVEEGEVETRPIKGTRPRWPAPEADMYSGGELRESDKDRAENVMIVDLLRNDLGRVCQYGSVRVADPLRLESYQFVHHLVSEVRGRLRSGLGLIDLLRAAFPGGSVTGAPKIRAMEIIAELEPTARGPYCGSLGYIGFDGSMDTSILIRTFTCGRGWLQFPVGGGIVAQSSPEREYEETLHKAEGMIRALR